MNAGTSAPFFSMNTLISCLSSYTWHSMQPNLVRALRFIAGIVNIAHSSGTEGAGTASDLTSVDECYSKQHIITQTKKDRKFMSACGQNLIN